MLTNFELKRLKPKLDIAKKPENRVHELTDSNVSRERQRSEPVGSPVKVVKVCFAYLVKPFTGEVVKVCSRPR